MKRISVMVIAAVATALLVAGSSEPASAADVPANRVVAIYFHRTQRCPTCQKMGSYSEEAIKRGFAKQLKDRTVAFHYVDFQAKKNAALAKGYRVNGPALIVAKITNKKVVESKNLKDMWTKVGDKPAFQKYVQNSVIAYRK